MPGSDIAERGPAPMIVLACRETNDLYQVLQRLEIEMRRADSVEQALAAAEGGSGVLVLADSYPARDIAVTAAHLDLARRKSLKLFVEYPRSMAGVDLGEPTATQWERVVVSSDFFAPALDCGRILALHGCWFLPVKAENAHLAVAGVAGYNRAVYDLPEGSSPILVEMPEHNALVAASCLSRFITARYGPSAAWKAIWRRILQWLVPSETIPDLTWEPVVTTALGADDPVPEDLEHSTLEKSLDWFKNEVIFSIDWKKGAIEGFEAGIDCYGRQKRRTWVRGDCTAETGMALAFDWALKNGPESRKLASQILDYVWSSPDFYQDDPTSPVYGLSNWYVGGPVFYGDDNARVIMPTLLASRLLDDDRWDDKVLRCLLANLRTTGPLGFRLSRLDWPRSFPDGRNWTYYRDLEHVHYAPHYQAYLWATYLWAYGLTEHEEFLTKPLRAIRMTMDVYPNWRWTNGFTQELARMLLPLAFLVRIQDTREHRDWLRLVADDLLQDMQPCGAIRERLGPIENGSYPPPKSNEDYGKTEASLIQNNGDPACDLLYTANYAILGLHEAWSATHEPRYRTAADRLAEFLCRIQVRSDKHRYLDGSWMRSFDYDLWEYWGSSADLGWGAWSVESGWTNTWIASVLAMRKLGISLFDLSLSERLRQRFPPVRDDMLHVRTPSRELADTGAGFSPGAE